MDLNGGMMTNTTRVIQIGVGNWGVNHKRILSELGVLEATVDVNNKEDYRFYSEIIGLDFDHAVVCTLPNDHYHLTKWLLESGKHVFVEKPLAETVDQCSELLELAKEKNLKLRVGYIERFNPYVKKIKDTKPKLVTFVRENKHYPHVKDNIVMDTAVHDIDLACWFFGCIPDTVTTQKDNWWKYSVIMLDFNNRGTAVIISSWLSDRKIRTINGISTMCSENILKLELEDFLNGEIKQDWNALHVMEVIDGVNRCH